MSLPQYYEFYRDVLDSLADGKIHTVSEMRNFILTKRHFSEEDLNELLPSGRVSVFANRTNWAWCYLLKAQLLCRPSRGKYQLTDEGKKIQKDRSIDLTNNYLMRYSSFAEFTGGISSGPPKAPSPSESNDVQLSTPLLISKETPQEIIDNAYKTINSALSDDLMQEILNQSPAFFEQLVVQLLLKMGYGGPFEDAGITTKPTNDGGIDGIIKEDKLGFNQIYIQAKRWDIDKSIPKPELQKFAGALLGEGASKGLFITTAKFSNGAKDFADKQHIVLIDGEMLTKLMIEYNLGVTTYKTYSLKSLDTDFFNSQE